MLTENEISTQLYLHDRESSLGIFILRCRDAKIQNKALAIKCGERITAKDFIVTPQEELFALFFNSEKIAVVEMTILELRAHREELAKIAFEARARLAAVDDEDRTRKARTTKEKGPTGFSTSLQTDEVTTDAINRIKERQKKMSKQEKLVDQMVKLGMDRKDAEAKVSAGTILARIKGMEMKKKSDDNNAASAPAFVNPFGPKPSSPAPVEVSIIEETNTVVIREAEISPAKPAGFINPFAK